MTVPSSTRPKVALLAGLLAVTATATVASAAEPLTLEQWSNLVWEAARQQDRGALDEYLQRFPEVPGDDRARRFRATLEQHHVNQADARVDRSENRASAREQMAEQLANDHVSQALTKAVEVQTLSDTPEEILGQPDVARVVARAKSQVPVARRDGDWLYAYELLYRLNVLYEHTGEYQEELDRVNRRLALLSYYAPKRLHELRQRQAARFDEEPLTEFNPALAEDWMQRLQDVDFRMVRTALDRAASEHIEGRGWRPLLIGGLEGLNMLATMPTLAETFPGLGDPDNLTRWLDVLEQERMRVERTDDGRLGYRYTSKLLDRLVENARALVDLPQDVVLLEFGDGAMEELDQFSEIIWPSKFHRFRQSTHGSFVGVGILIRHDEKRHIMVVNPLEGTPAYFAGVKPNDRIVSVDGGSTAGWSLNDAVDRITGPKGTEVVLGLKRDGVEGVVEVPIIRDIIKIHSVKGWWKSGLDRHGDPMWDWFIDANSRIAYVRVSAFNEDTYDDLRRAWSDIRDEGRPYGLILDLRYNPGGLLSSAVQVSNLFVREGVIVSGEEKDGTEAWPAREAEPNKALIARDNVPVVVLINQGSASASEIVAGCLQAHGAAVVVGQRSYGKGSVQTVHPIAHRAVLKLTTQYYRLPPTPAEQRAGRKGRLVHRRTGAMVWGVDPDVEVTATPQQIQAAYDLRQAADIVAAGDEEEPAERPDINDLLTEGLDPQLETALLILQAKALGAPADETRHAMAD